VKEFKVVQKKIDSVVVYLPEMHAVSGKLRILFTAG